MSMSLSLIGTEKLGQPQPDSNWAFESNRGPPHPAQ
ncbi:hypothetical protein ES708_15999 [subsurface metagenome]